MLGVDNHVEIWNPQSLEEYNLACDVSLQRFHGASCGGRRMSGEFRHIPVLLDETLTLLAPERGGTFVDGTWAAAVTRMRCLRACPKAAD